MKHRPPAGLPGAGTSSSSAASPNPDPDQGSGMTCSDGAPTRATAGGVSDERTLCGPNPIRRRAPRGHTRGVLSHLRVHPTTRIARDRTIRRLQAEHSVPRETPAPIRVLSNHARLQCPAASSRRRRDLLLHGPPEHGADHSAPDASSLLAALPRRLHHGRDPPTATSQRRSHTSAQRHSSRHAAHPAFAASSIRCYTATEPGAHPTKGLTCAMSPISDMRATHAENSADAVKAAFHCVTPSSAQPPAGAMQLRSHMRRIACVLDRERSHPARAMRAARLRAAQQITRTELRSDGGATAELRGRALSHPPAEQWPPTANARSRRRADVACDRPPPRACAGVTVDSLRSSKARGSTHAVTRGRISDPPTLQTSPSSGSPRVSLSSVRTILRYLRIDSPERTEQSSISKVLIVSERWLEPHVWAPQAGLRRRPRPERRTA